MKKSLLALVVSVAAASGAHASWFTGANPAFPGPDGGNGEALLSVFDNVAGKSYGLDLGVRYDDLVSGAAFNGQSIAVDLSVFGGALSSVQWMVTNSSGSYLNADASAATFDKYGVMLTTQVGLNRTPVGQTADQWANQIGSFQLETTNAAASKLALNSGAVSQNGSASAPNAGDAHYIGGTDWGTYFNSQTGINGLAAVGGTLKLTLMGFTDVDGTSPFTKDLGTVTLTGSTLTFNQAAPTVPVPAAAWLMGSALLGLGGVSRRRNSK